MKKLLIFLFILGFSSQVTACSSSNGSSQSNESNNVSSSSDTEFTLNEDAGIMYMCNYYTKRGNVCYAEVNIKYNGTDARETTLSAKAYDDQNRSYVPRTDPESTTIVEGGTFTWNPGQEFVWDLEFPVTKGTHLKKLNIYQDEKLVKTFDLDLLSE